VTKLDRLARSILYLWEIVQGLDAKGVALRILNLGGETVDTHGATGLLNPQRLAAFVQFEREMMLERQREGIAKAKAAGKYKGRKPTARAKGDEAVRLFQEGKRVSDIARALGVGRGGLYRALETAGVKAG
jgi:DNA invertase Pin-like site-specific DNA recombinase